VRALDVKVGDRVLFGKYAGQAVKLDGDEVLVDARRRHHGYRRVISACQSISIDSKN